MQNEPIDTGPILERLREATEQKQAESLREYGRRAAKELLASARAADLLPGFCLQDAAELDVDVKAVPNLFGWPIVLRARRYTRKESLFEVGRLFREPTKWRPFRDAHDLHGRTKLGRLGGFVVFESQIDRFTAAGCVLPNAVVELRVPALIVPGWGRLLVLCRLRDLLQLVELG